ncbi:MAG: ester cyclase [Acidimicrobiales bacterium]
MNTAEAKSLVRSLIDAFRSREPAGRLAELLTPDYVQHAPGGEVTKGVTAMVADVVEMFSAFADFTPTIELQVAEGDLVATRVRWRGTHTGDFGPVGATGRSVGVTVTRIDRIDRGRVAESWLEYDPNSLVRQIS